MTTADYLTGLRDHVRRLNDCATEGAVADGAVDAATDAIPATAAVLYAVDRDALRRLAAVGAPPPRTLAVRAFETGTRANADDAVAVPVGDSGALAITGPDLGSSALAATELLAAAAASALERVGATPATTRTPSSDLLDLLRNVSRGVVRVSTREDVQRVTCERLVGVGDAEFAWFGAHRPTEGAVVPTARAGTGDGYLDVREFPTDGTAFTPQVLDRVIDDHELVVLDRLADALPGPAAGRASERGFRSAAFLPVVDDGSLYGVFAVYATRPGAFDEQTRSVLAAVGDLVALALRAVEQKRAVVGDATTEVEFSLDDDDIALVELSRYADCNLDLDGVFLDADDRLWLFVTIADTTAAAFDDAAAATDGVTGAELVADRGDELLYRVEAEGTPLSTYLAEQGIALQTVSLSGGTGRAVVELHGDVSVRSVVDRVQTAYPDTEFLAQRDRTEQPRSSSEFRVLIEDRLTDRQHEALQSAYHGGFYEWPRESTGEDLAALLDIAQPTLLQHLRAAEQKLLAAFFEERRYVYSR